jgi:hypothetical protein
MLLPADHEGEVDQRASGITYFDPNRPDSVPREWMTQGDYSVGLDREKHKQEAIERAFHVDLFRMFSMLDKQMTAREVSERSSEKLNQFTPAFARKTTEVFNPMLRRVFSLLLKAGQFPAPPQSAIVQDPNTGEAYIPEPDVTYTSRIALAIKQLQNVSFMRSMEMLTPLVQVKPEILDNIDTDQVARDAMRNDGMPADWLVDEKQRDEMREARAEAIAEQQQQQQMMMMAEAAGKAGNVKGDSVLGQALTQHK